MVTKCKLVVKEQPTSPAAEAFRVLRINLQFARTDYALKTVMFTSAAPTEGKSTVIANAAISMAQAGKKVIILDCDLRKPVQNKFFCLQNFGLTNALLEGTPVRSLIQKTYIENLCVMASGPVPPNPSELLSTQQMYQTLASLKEYCDVVLLDAPPVVAVTDALILASQVDGVVLVVDSRGVNRPEILQRAKNQLLKAQGYILGTILNRAQEANNTYYQYYYGSETQAAQP